MWVEFLRVWLKCFTSRGLSDIKEQHTSLVSDVNKWTQTGILMGGTACRWTVYGNNYCVQREKNCWYLEKGHGLGSSFVRQHWCWCLHFTIPGPLTRADIRVGRCLPNWHITMCREERCHERRHCCFLPLPHTYIPVPGLNDSSSLCITCQKLRFVQPHMHQTTLQVKKTLH